MIIEKDYKEEGKKLIRIEMELGGDNVIRRVSIRGDFFLYPEESIEDLERMLSGILLDEIQLKEILDEFFQGVVAFGIDKVSLSNALIGCKDGI